jgi:glycerol-1-phosphate dehydrogenase [NAD(P)+]
MADDRITAALREATDTEDVLVGAGVLASTGEVFKRNFGDQAAVLVADENTMGAAGEPVRRSLADAGVKLEEPYVFPGSPSLYAEYANIEKLRDALRGVDAIVVAIGSGTLNDIAKRAASELGRPYMNVSTAASMDGYTAFGASIQKDNLKQTLSCPAPKAVLADLDVLTRAPARMTAAGHADLLGKVPAGADWILADALGAEAIHPTAWSLVQEPLREAIGRPAALQAGDADAMQGLIDGLIMSGLAMQAHQSSRPASGAEHQFSHLWEMEGLGHSHGEDPPLSHGFKVGLGSIAMAALYERVLERDLTQVDVEARRAAWPSWDEVEARVRAAHTPELVEGFVKESQAKYIDADALAQRLERLREVWPELREKLRRQLMPAQELRDNLKAAGCPTTPGEIGLDMDAFKATYVRAQMIRRRYTALDVTTEAGILEELVEELFAPGGFWAREGAVTTA